MIQPNKMKSSSLPHVHEKLDKSVIYPIIASFRLLVQCDDSGQYSWIEDPFDFLEREKHGIAVDVLNVHQMQPPTKAAKFYHTWQTYEQHILIAQHTKLLAELKESQ